MTCLPPSDPKSKKEFIFSVTRMRCWRLYGNDDDGLQLAFDYMRAKDQMQWTKVQSANAIFMSMCLQALVTELIRTRKGERIRRPKDRVRLEEARGQNELFNQQLPLTCISFLL